MQHGQSAEANGKFRQRSYQWPARITRLCRNSCSDLFSPRLSCMPLRPCCSAQSKPRPVKSWREHALLKHADGQRACEAVPAVDSETITSLRSQPSPGAESYVQNGNTCRNPQLLPFNLRPPAASHPAMRAAQALGPQSRRCSNAARPARAPLTGAPTFQTRSAEYRHCNAWRPSSCKFRAIPKAIRPCETVPLILRIITN